jgi:hypothetical protein
MEMEHDSVGVALWSYEWVEDLITSGQDSLICLRLCSCTIIGMSIEIKRVFDDFDFLD